jgi:SAM-dependent methyltransferase
MAREMMFGYSDEFEYFECAQCGCLQIRKYASDLPRYYPESYYSHKVRKNLKKNVMRTFLRRQRSKYCLFGKNKLWLLRSDKYDSFKWFKKPKLKFESSILDIGCGTGRRLLRMHRDGFSNLTGVDQHIKDSIFYRNGVNIFKKNLFELEGQFDFIMAHHSLEHMQQPLNTFRKLYSLLKPNRYALIRLPVASSFAWRHYGVNWVALDAPRHLYLHTVKSIELLSKQTGFIMEEVKFDSTEFQFLGSELYLKGIPLKNGNRYFEIHRRPIFAKEQIEAFKEKAIELNKKNDGDQACFYLYKN